jgi:hypothetical protein
VYLGLDSGRTCYSLTDLARFQSHDLPHSRGRCVQASGLLQPLFVVVFAYDGPRLPGFGGLVLHFYWTIRRPELTSLGHCKVMQGRVQFDR